MAETLDLDKAFDSIGVVGLGSIGEKPEVYGGVVEKCILNNFFNSKVTFDVDKKGMRDILKTIEISEDTSNLLVILTEIQNKIGNYFGGDCDDNLKRFDAYMTSGFKCSLSDLKNKRVAQCAEKASVAQNILLAIIQTGLIKKFNSNFVSSKLNNNPHAFILLESKEKEGTSYIFDIENPSTIILPDGTKKTFIGVYPISREQLIDFYNGKSIKLKSILHGKNGMKETGVDRFYGNEEVKLPTFPTDQDSGGR